ncbi:dnaJ homolog subfamily C member 12 [Octopus bimaculoides]|uniref:J domain-containing protein n=1 Tax=Octopus bimaculoides TaxID=37653 RepID=A0A0L8FR78_OCTBM|nr:dnaJ homolog subfamily C member 12 [Octopus bimaculoides]|eukprot:XP_014787648.1 PREDICTED: dnaJ homolog subfamily C member 12-like [Octopus bimaculoides]
MTDVLNYEFNPDEDYYKILGCHQLSTIEQINAEYKARVLSCHPDKHPDDPQAAKRFILLQIAKDVLSCPGSRKKYDQWLNSGLAISFKEWCSMNDKTHSSMHWASTKPKPFQVKNNEEDECPAKLEKCPQWHKRDDCPMLEKFRNYEI